MIGFGNGALGRVVRSGVGRRRVQTLVIAVATMMAVASAVVVHRPVDRPRRVRGLPAGRHV
ncbi:hypothetical protein ACWEBX_39910, partial [Streptomyces sp. NPDC005070]